MTITPDRLDAFQSATLAKGSHPAGSDEKCAIEWADWLAGGSGVDSAPCVSPVLRTYTISLNDQWTDEQRQQLKPFLPRMVGTSGDGQDEARAYLALDWLIRTYTPAWMDLAGLTTEAQALHDLRRIVDLVAAQQAGPVVRAARDKASAAWAAAGDAARAAAWAAVWAAARDAAGDAARDAARAAVWAAAGDAAWAAVWAAAWAAVWAAAGAAGGEKLRPTVVLLQASALNLLDHMIDPSAVTS